MVTKKHYKYMGLYVKLCAKPFYMHILLNSHNNPEKDNILYLTGEKLENDLPPQSGLIQTQLWLIAKLMFTPILHPTMVHRVPHGPTPPTFLN